MKKKQLKDGEIAPKKFYRISNEQLFESFKTAIPQVEDFSEVADSQLRNTWRTEFHKAEKKRSFKIDEIMATITSSRIDRNSEEETEHMKKLEDFLKRELLRRGKKGKEILDAFSGIAGMESTKEPDESDDQRAILSFIRNVLVNTIDQKQTDWPSPKPEGEGEADDDDDDDDNSEVKEWITNMYSHVLTMHDDEFSVAFNQPVYPIFMTAYRCFIAKLKQSGLPELGESEWNSRAKRKFETLALNFLNDLTEIYETERGRQLFDQCIEEVAVALPENNELVKKLSESQAESLVNEEIGRIDNSIGRIKRQVSSLEKKWDFSFQFIKLFDGLPANETFEKYISSVGTNFKGIMNAINGMLKAFVSQSRENVFAIFKQLVEDQIFPFALRYEKVKERGDSHTLLEIQFESFEDQLTGITDSSSKRNKKRDIQALQGYLYKTLEAIHQNPPSKLRIILPDLDPDPESVIDPNSISFALGFVDTEKTEIEYSCLSERQFHVCRELIQDHPETKNVSLILAEKTSSKEYFLIIDTIAETDAQKLTLVLEDWDFRSIMEFTNQIFTISLSKRELTLVLINPKNRTGKTNVEVNISPPSMLPVSFTLYSEEEEELFGSLSNFMTTLLHSLKDRNVNTSDNLHISENYSRPAEKSVKFDVNRKSWKNDKIIRKKNLASLKEEEAAEDTNDDSFKAFKYTRKIDLWKKR